jgi:heptosyltransferase I
VLALLRDRWPAAQIDWLIAPAFASLLTGHPMVSEVILFKRRNGESHSPLASGTDFLELMRHIADRNYDLVIDLQGLLRSGLLTWASGATARVGFATAREGASLGYNIRVASRGTERHAIERYLDVAEELGLGRGPVRFPFHVTDADRGAVDDMLRDAREDFAVLLPGTNWPTKRWPAERFAMLGPRVERELGLRVVVAGVSDAVGVASQMHNARPIDLAMKTSTVPQLIEVIRRAKLVICHDSAPMHIAAALGKPMVALIGPTNPVRTGPYQREDAVLRLNIECSPCYARTCSHQSCLRWIGVDAVIDAARGQLGHGTKRSP